MTDPAQRSLQERYTPGIPWAASSLPTSRGLISGSKPPCRRAGARATFWRAKPWCPAGAEPKARPWSWPISDNAYIPLITCPVLWLSPTNDFHAHIDNMAWNWRNVPDDRVRFSISPHLNHRHTDEHAITEYLWFEEHLKGSAFRMPQTPRMTLELKPADGVPRVTVTPDDSQPVQRVDIYYSLDPHGLTRFWRDAKAVKEGRQWKAECPVMNLEQPIFAYANVAYETPAAYRTGPQPAGQERSPTFAISSRVLSAGPAQLRAAGVKATDKPDRAD